MTPLALKFIIFCHLVSSFTSAVPVDRLPNTTRCEPITTELCKDMTSYTHTMMPNFLNHKTQEEANLEANQFLPLVKVQCSRDLQLFLCSLYVPACGPAEGSPAPPCRSLCQSAQSGCKTLVNALGFSWPSSLDCAKFPEAGGSKDCLGGSNAKDQQIVSSNGKSSHGVPTPSPDPLPTARGELVEAGPQPLANPTPPRRPPTPPAVNV